LLASDDPWAQPGKARIKFAKRTLLSMSLGRNRTLRNGWLAGVPSLFIAFGQRNIFALHMRDELTLKPGRKAIPIGFIAGIAEDHFIVFNILPLIPARSELKQAIT
jgi:hypothetical protein